MGSLLIMLLLLARATLGKRVRRRVVYAAWLLVVLRLLLPLSLPNPLMNELRPRLSANYAARPIADQIRVRTIDAAYDASVALAGDDVTKLDGSWLYQLGMSLQKGMLGNLLLVVYCGGAAATMGVLLCRNLRFRRRLRRGKVEQVPDQQLEDFIQLCAQKRIRPLPVWRVEGLPASCVAGWLHPFVALPANIHPESYAVALRHEAAHLYLRDGWWNLLRCVCCVVHWFNPLVWLAASVSRLDGEVACDERTLQGKGQEEREAYIRKLETVAGKHSFPELGVQASGMIMKAGRIRLRQRLLREHGQTGWGTVAFAVLALLVACCAFFTGEIEYAPSLERGFQVMAGVSQPEERIKRQVITTREDAEQWFVKLLESEFIQAESSQATVEFVGGRWHGTAGGFTATFNGEGVITAFYNATPLEITLKEAGQALTYDQNEALYAYVRAFMKACMPDVSIDHMRVVQDYTGSSGYFITCEGGHSHCNWAYRFMVQLDPQVRVVSFSLLDSEERALIRVSSLAGAATSQPGDTPMPTGRITMAQAREIAQDRVERMGGDVTSMSSTSRLDETDPEQPMWIVTYSVSGALCYEVDMDARNGEVQLFVDYIKQTIQSAAEEGLPAPEQLSKEEAIALARQAVAERYGFGEQEVAGFLVSYTGIRLEGSAWLGATLETDVWRISFRMPDTDVAYISDYDVLLDAVTGEILYIFDPSNNGNG